MSAWFLDSELSTCLNFSDFTFMINSLGNILFSLNFYRIKVFTDFVVISQTVKNLTSKYLSKHTFCLKMS